MKKKFAKIFFLLLVVLLIGCATSKKKYETDTSPGQVGIDINK